MNSTNGINAIDLAFNFIKRIKEKYIKRKEEKQCKIVAIESCKQIRMQV